MLKRQPFFDNFERPSYIHVLLNKIIWIIRIFPQKGSFFSNNFIGVLKSFYCVDNIVIQINSKQLLALVHWKCLACIKSMLINWFLCESQGAASIAIVHMLMLTLLLGMLKRRLRFQLNITPCSNRSTHETVTLSVVLSFTWSDQSKSMYSWNSQDIECIWQWVGFQC